MSTSSFIAKRYLFSRTHISLISTLTYISIAGVTIGTALLIVVVVAMDFMSQVQTHLMSHQYESLMKKSNIQNFGRR